MPAVSSCCSTPAHGSSAPRVSYTWPGCWCSRVTRATDPSDLAWGVLQSPAEGLRASTDAGDIRALMAARTHETVEAAMVAAWADRLGPVAKREERWLVTHARDARTASRLEAATLAVAEADEPLASALVLVATSSASLKHGAVLPLPPRRACGRLLRDPFHDEPRGALVRTPHPDATIAAGAQVVFSATSPHVLARLESGAIVALAVSTDEERAIRRIATLVPAEGTAVVAAGWRKGKMYVLTTDEAKVMLHTGRGSRWFPSMSFTDLSGFTLPIPVTSPAVLGRLLVDRDGAKLYFCDERWRLLTADLRARTVGRSARPSSRAIICLRPGRDSPASCGRRRGISSCKCCSRTSGFG